MNVGMQFIHPERKAMCEVVTINSLPYPGKVVLLAYVVAMDGSFSDYVPMDLLVRDEREYCQECGQHLCLHDTIPATATDPEELQCPEKNLRYCGEKTWRDNVHDNHVRLGWSIPGWTE